MATLFTETLHEGFRQVMEVTAMLADEQTDWQHVQIFDTVNNGRVMALDGIVQISTRDEAAYSEMLAHVPVMARRAAGLPAERVLIVGGGDGAVAEEVLKHQTVRQVELADIDGRVVDLCREHFREVSGAAFRDPRLDVRIVDAFEHLEREDSAGVYDIIIADRPDPVGPAQVLFADAFYAAVARALSPKGVAVFQNGVPFFQAKELTETMPQLRRAFADTGVYLTVVPTYSGGYMALSWASNGLAPDAAAPDELRRLWAQAGLSTDYYSPDFHRAAFVLPPWMERLCGKDKSSGKVHRAAPGS
ncbi:MAG: polyamine aminopropyltransferase [Alphaproteobacteria bacterium]